MSENPTLNLPLGWCWSEASALIGEISAGKSFQCDERPPQDGETGVVKVSAVSWGSYDEMESKTCTRAELINPGLFVRPGDFLFSRANTIELVGACVIADKVTRNVMLSDKILRFSVRPGWDKWLLWSLRSSHGRAEIERLATGNQDSMRNIGQSRVHSIQIPIPQSGEHHRIVSAIESYFTRLDDAMATLSRVERNLKRYRASVLKSAVEGRLVPTEAALAKQEGRDYEPASVLLERILTERRRRWTESGKKGKYEEPASPDTTGLPELPEGWCWATVEQVCSSVTDGDHLPPPQTESGIPFLVIGNVRSGDVDLRDTRYVSAEYYNKLDLTRRPQFGDILYTVTGSFGIPVLVRSKHKFCVQRHISILRPLALVNAPYLRRCLQSQLVFLQANAIATGTAQKTVPLKGLRRIAIPLPPMQEQSRILDAIERHVSLIESVEGVIERETCNCSRLRQSILKWAFEGKLADQDPSDEPASVLLERIKAERDIPKSAKKKSRA